MRSFKIFSTLLISLFMIALSNQSLQAECTYVTDAGGYAYDECRASTNLAPAIALGTVVIVAIIAIAVQNSHDGHSSHSHSSFFHGHFTSSSGS
jgi:hypothetical protein